MTKNRTMILKSISRPQIATSWEKGDSSMDLGMTLSFNSTSILTLSLVFCRFFSLILHQRILRKLKEEAQLSSYHTFNYVFLQKSLMRCFFLVMNLSINPEPMELQFFPEMSFLSSATLFSNLATFTSMLGGESKNPVWNMIFVQMAVRIRGRVNFLPKKI